MLPFSISLRRGIRIHDQVVFAVTRAVVTRQLSPGDPFPSVRTLSQELRINPNTAHKIVATLIADGLLTVRPGIGTVVDDAIPDGGRRAIADDEIERFVVLSKRAGASLQDVLVAIRRHWTTTKRKAE